MFAYTCAMLKLFAVLIGDVLKMDLNYIVSGYVRSERSIGPRMAG